MSLVRQRVTPLDAGVRGRSGCLRRGHWRATTDFASRLKDLAGGWIIHPRTMMTPLPSDDPFATRQSLLSRLKDLGDQDGWQEFFETYRRLIYAVARRAGLSDSEAQDVVQETMVVVAQQMPGFRYDPDRGSFKAWRHTVIRGRLSRHWRKARRHPSAEMA